MIAHVHSDQMPPGTVVRTETDSRPTDRADLRALYQGTGQPTTGLEGDLWLDGTTMSILTSGVWVPLGPADPLAVSLPVFTVDGTQVTATITVTVGYATSVQVRAGASGAAQQNWPIETVTFPPGGGTHVYTETLEVPYGDYWGYSSWSENSGAWQASSSVSLTVEEEDPHPEAFTISAPEFTVDGNQVTARIVVTSGEPTTLTQVLAMATPRAGGANIQWQVINHQPLGLNDTYIYEYTRTVTSGVWDGFTSYGHGGTWSGVGWEEFTVP